MVTPTVGSFFFTVPFTERYKVIFSTPLVYLQWFGGLPGGHRGKSLVFVVNHSTIPESGVPTNLHDYDQRDGGLQENSGR